MPEPAVAPLPLLQRPPEPPARAPQGRLPRPAGRAADFGEASCSLVQVLEPQPYVDNYF